MPRSFFLFIFSLLISAVVCVGGCRLWRVGWGVGAIMPRSLLSVPRYSDFWELAGGGGGSQWGGGGEEKRGGKGRKGKRGGKKEKRCEGKGKGEGE